VAGRLVAFVLWEKQLTAQRGPQFSYLSFRHRLASKIHELLECHGVYPFVSVLPGTSEGGLKHRPSAARADDLLVP
jgi:hypothetical protein